MDWWDCMRNGDVDNALQSMRESFVAEGSLTDAISLGTGYLWTQQYERAWTHLDSYNRSSPFQYAPTINLAGVAQWCMNDPDAAVEQWQLGCRAEYGDTIGLNIQPPLLLFFASVAAPGSFPKAAAEELLEEKAADPRSEKWPLVQFVLGRIGECELRDESASATNTPNRVNTLVGDPRIERGIRLHRWRGDFWQGVLELAAGNTERYRDIMQRTGDVTWDEYDECRDLFLIKFRLCEELYLARHEAG